MESELKKVDSSGRITIPKAIREKLDIHSNEELEVRLQGKAIIIARPGDESGQAGGGQAFTTFKKLEKGTPEWYENTEVHLIHCPHCQNTKYARLFKNTEKLICKECGTEINFKDKKRISVECPDCSTITSVTVAANIKKIDCKKCGRKVKVGK